MKELNLKKTILYMNFFTSGFQGSSKIFLTCLQKPVCIMYDIFCTRNHIYKKYFFLLLLFLGRKAKEKEVFVFGLHLPLDLINLFSIILLLNRRQRGPIRSVLLVIIGWLVTQFSQKWL